MCCSVLQCVVVCCSVLQCVWSRCVYVSRSVLQCVAVCCSVLYLLYQLPKKTTGPSSAWAGVNRVPLPNPGGGMRAAGYGAYGGGGGGGGVIQTVKEPVVPAGLPA